MYSTDTLTYPYILISRQIQMIKFCNFGTNSFNTKEYGFSLSAPKEFCFLPNRIFPADGTIQIVPRGSYFVINEYATGSVIVNSKSTLLFERIAKDRNTKAVLEALKNGGFLSEAKTTEQINKNGLKITVVKNVKGVDGPNHFDWAFIEHPNGKVFLSILLANQDTTIFDYILENIKTN